MRLNARLCENVCLSLALRLCRRVSNSLVAPFDQPLGKQFDLRLCRLIDGLIVA
ncbi:MAG: hypothetical protein R6X13_05530 [bacterium]